MIIDVIQRTVNSGEWYIDNNQTSTQIAINNKAI